MTVAAAASLALEAAIHEAAQRRIVPDYRKLVEGERQFRRDVYPAEKIRADAEYIAAVAECDPDLIEKQLLKPL